MNPNPLAVLRKQLRQQRRALDLKTRQQAGRRVSQHLYSHSTFRQAQRIGIYLSAFGEVPTTAIIELGFKLGKQVYLPQIRNFDQKLRWVRISRQQWRNKRFSVHRLGMHEPRARGWDVNHLDLLIMPLLAFDSHGSRLGMGGGYYDRTLWKKNQPYRMGLAYAFQHTSTLVRQPWDQPLHAVCTPEGINRFKSITPSITHFFVNK